MKRIINRSAGLTKCYGGLSKQSLHGTFQLLDVA